jgi:thiamine phosphate synthase YjbQ (UPF0047 family)
MGSRVHTLELKTREQTQFLDITSEIRKLVAESGVMEGTCFVYVLNIIYLRYKYRFI